ncbi:MAG: NUDIX domain-containing protein [Pseudomonadales bacterium]
MVLSAGLLMFRRRDGLELFLVHPGGPFFRNKDGGAWSIPKGEVEPSEDPLSTARREFSEETGIEAPDNGYVALGEIRQKGGKRVTAWAFEGDCDPAAIRSNTFEIEWPPRSGKRQSFPEVDRADFFAPDAARVKLNAAQAELVSRLENALAKSET